MRRVAGYTLFWLAVGMLISLLIQDMFWSVFLISVLLMIGYHLFVN
ncbi:MAG: hypothetical protein Q4B57_08980 [Eubacteriales bacterium]|nr:hypothetical protein [Eubacteriales bacterium]